MVQSPRKNSARLSAGPCRIRLRAFRLHPSPPQPLLDTATGPSGCVLSLAGFPVADPATRSPAGCGCGLFRLHPSPPRPLPTAGPFGCPLCPFWLWRGGGAVKQPSASREDRLRRAAAVGSVWRKGGMTGGRRLPGLQGGLVRMAGGDCRVCKVRLVAWRAAVAGSAK